MIVCSICAYAGYLEASDRAVTVEAQVADIKPESGDGSGYDVYASFVYNGSSYRVHYANTPDASAWTPGEKLSLTIDPHNPEREIKDYTDIIFFSLFFGAIVLTLGFGVMLFSSVDELPSSPDEHPQRHGKKTLPAEYRRAYWLPCFVFAIVMIVGGAFLLKIDSIGVGCILMGSLGVAVGVPLMWVYIKNLSRIKQARKALESTENGQK